MEKHQNKYRINILKKIALLFISLISLSITAQTNKKLDYSSPKNYEIGGIMVNGADHLNNNTLISISGLEIGETIKIPGDNISTAITKLWTQGLFADVAITIDKVVENLVYLNIDLIEHSRLSKFKFKGKKVSKSDVTTLKEDLKLMRGKVLTQNLINNSINKIKKYFVNTSISSFLSLNGGTSIFITFNL